jgi:hypothetical protein
LEKAQDFSDSRHSRADAILYADVEATGEFYFRKIEHEVETQLGNPTEMRKPDAVNPGRHLACGVC